MTTILIVSIILTALLSFVLAWLFFKQKLGRETSILQERLDQSGKQLLNLQNQYETSSREALELNSRASRAESQNEMLSRQAEAHASLMNIHAEAQSQLAVMKAKLTAAEEKLLSQKKDVEELGEKFKFEFRTLAQNILEEKTEKFTKVNEEKMKAILDPLKSEIGIFKLKVEETYDKESKERFSLGKEVQRLIEMSQAVSLEANNLTAALKGNNKMQGNWGEMILESLLENSGLSKGREYFVQEFIRDSSGNIIKDENGKGLQPDVTICYPDQRKVIIDSKVSLVAWDECNSQESRDEQMRCLLEHIRSLRSHIDQLSRKNYPKYALALDYVLLFVPIEPAFLEAVKTDTTLWKYAYDKKILLVSPTNLFAVLKIIADLWRVEQQNKNAIDIATKAGALYDKFVSFTENFESVGKKLTEANNHYENAFKQLSTGRGNLVGKVEELRKIGAKASKSIPEKILLQSGEDENEEDDFPLQ